MDFDDIENRFTFHPATTNGRKAEHAAVRELFLNTAHELVGKIPAGREAALAVTRLEEAMAWAAAAIARTPEPYEPTPGRRKNRDLHEPVPGQLSLTGDLSFLTATGT